MGDWKSKIHFFFNSDIFCLKYNDTSFEVWYVSVSQKLVILGFLSKIFFHFDLGHFQNGNLTYVSNFSWRCKLLYEVLFVKLGWNHILTWPKSPHRLGLIGSGHNLGHLNGQVHSFSISASDIWPSLRGKKKSFLDKTGLMRQIYSLED